MLGDIDAYVDEQVALSVGTSVLIQVRQTLATHTQHLTRLGTRRDGDLDITRERRYLHLSTQYGGRHIEQQVVYQVVALTHQVLALLFLDENEQVARYTAMRRRITLALHGERHAVGYTGRDLDGDNLLVANDAFALTLGALITDDLTLAVTLRAVGLYLHHAQEAALLTIDHTTSLTLLTGLALTSIGTTGTVARGTGYEFTHLDLLIHAGSYLLERQAHLDTQVGTAAHTT